MIESINFIKSIYVCKLGLAFNTAEDKPNKHVAAGKWSLKRSRNRSRRNNRSGHEMQ